MDATLSEHSSAQDGSTETPQGLSLAPAGPLHAPDAIQALHPTKPATAHPLLSNDALRRNAHWTHLLQVQRDLESESLSEGAANFRRRLEKSEEKGRASTMGAARHLLTHAIEPTAAAIRFWMAEQQARRGVRHCAVTWLNKLSEHTIEPIETEDGPRWLVKAIDGKVVGRYNSEEKAKRKKTDCEALRPGADAAAFMAVRAILDELGKKNSVREISLRISGLLLDELRFRRFEYKAPGLFEYKMNSFNTSSYVHMARSMAAAMRYAEVDISDLEMSPTHRVLVGTKLIDLVLQATKLIEIESATKVITRRRALVRNELLVVPTEETKAFMAKRNSVLEFLAPVLMPMVVPPMQWEVGRRGGYRFALRNTVPLVRGSNAQTKRIEESDLQLVYSSLNAIQNTPWKINGHVLALVEQMADNHIGLAGLPTEDREPDPPKPEDIDTNEVARRAWRRVAHRVKERNHARENKALEFARVMTAATRMKDQAAFFFPHNLDFRGRIYPIPHHLTPQGDDLQKALLTFSTGKPLGPMGASYLALHGINCMDELPAVNGVRRKVSAMTLEERIAWVTSNEAEIYAAAKDPLSYRWWAEAKYPLMFYAFCVEWAGFMDASKTGNGHDYVCHLPVSIDGACNGLQHFAAMLRDPVSARAVNVTPNAEPQDVYLRIAEAVKDWLESVQGADADLAAMWLASGLVTRDLTKRPTMTFSYGSKHYGFQEQLVQYLLDLENSAAITQCLVRTDDREKKPRQALAPACRLMASAIWESLQSQVSGAFKAMEWMQKVARQISQTGNPIEWTVPVSGFHVRQEYFESKRRLVTTVLAGRVIAPRVFERTNDIQVHKQANAVSPNVVHSLDAAGLMIAVSLAQAEGVEQFATVHDSYGALPADMEIIWRTARQSFVHLYTQHNIIRELAEQFQAQAKMGQDGVREAIPEPPPLGALDVSAVLASDYFFC